MYLALAKSDNSVELCYNKDYFKKKYSGRKHDV